VRAVVSDLEGYFCEVRFSMTKPIDKQRNAIPKNTKITVYASSAGENE
jgi:hypothetical protein